MQRFPLVTIEPWTTASNDGHNILADTAYGANDAIIRADAQAIKAQAPQVVIVRFAHEMELTENYPWAIANPSLYIQAYRHYVDLFRAEGATNVLWMWSPAGNGDAPRFYPGDAYIDSVGLTILSNKEWDLSVGATDALSFDELFAVKYRTVARFKKPIFIAEFGVANDSDGRQAAWLQNAYASFAQYPLLRGVVYFNSMNAPNSWTGTIPNFQLSGTILWPEDTALPAEPRRRETP
jgi:beta-mannanase